MNRKQRRAAAKRGEALAAGARMGGRLETPNAAGLMAEARQHYHQGRAAQAQVICDRLLAREPSHVEALKLLGVIAQESGRYRLAIKLFARGIAADPLHGGCHYNLASCHQALDQRDEALVHFRQAILIVMRKTREDGLRNIEYAQADILKLPAADRSFDRIEAVGVLHHMADPKAGWRALLSLLRPGGEMRIALYSEIARQAVVEARAFITEHGYRATAEDIRTCRQVLMRGDSAGRWKELMGTSDFYSMSGCRDLQCHGASLHDSRDQGVFARREALVSRF